MELTKDYLTSLFKYNDGEIYWKISLSPRIKIGDKAGHLRNDGDRGTTINNKLYGNHRLIFMMFNGYFPIEVDHIDGNPINNKIENLRPATVNQNRQNSSIRKDNKSGCKGVYWKKDSKKWSVQIQANGKRINIGVFDNLELADLVAQEARDKFHGKYARN